MMETLHVYLHGKHAGSLFSDKGKLSFAYETAYLQQNDAAPLSYTLPLQEEKINGGPVVSFFSNLLPDDAVRVKVARYLGISAENVFALLKRIGEDCAGAVSLVPPEREPFAQSGERYKELTEDEAHEILTSLPTRPLHVGAEGVHISGAGAQDKLVACIKNGCISIPLYGTPSTHIIKPGVERFPESVYNEYYCMKLALRCGLNAADCDIIQVKGIPYYVTTRYDRMEKSRWQRLHQEDFCQLLGFEPSVKYESEGGPRLTQCFQLIREMELPASDVIEFFRRILFIFLIGNGDAHAKNFSILYTNGRARLAPAYDLLSTTIYPELPAKLAMKIEGFNHFEWISRNKLLRLGNKVGFSSRLVNKEINKLITKLDKELAAYTGDCHTRFPSPVYQQIAQGIRQRLNQIREQNEAKPPAPGERCRGED